MRLMLSREGSEGNDGREYIVQVVGIFHSSDDDDKAIFTSTSVLQEVTNLPDSVNQEVKALTTLKTTWRAR